MSEPHHRSTGVGISGQLKPAIGGFAEDEATAGPGALLPSHPPRFPHSPIPHFPGSPIRRLSDRFLQGPAQVIEPGLYRTAELDGVGRLGCVALAEPFRQVGETLLALRPKVIQ